MQVRAYLGAPVWLVLPVESVKAFVQDTSYGPVVSGITAQRHLACGVQPFSAMSFLQSQYGLRLSQMSQCPMVR